MMRGCCRTEDALTGLELVILVIVFVAGAAFILILLGGTPDLSRTFPGGVAAESMYISGDHIQTVGNVYGFPMTRSRISDTLPVIVVTENPNQLGIVRFTVSLFIGSTGAIDMDRVQVHWIRKDRSESIQKTSSKALICPNWTISGKYNLLPGRTADSDEWLEPNEQFELTLCPSEGTRPYGTFSLNLQPDGIAMPLTVTRMAPARIQPVMNLG